MKALISLENNDKLIIKPSDKGGNVVLLNSPDYCQMCLAILQDSSCYKTLSYNPTNIYMMELKSILDMALGSLIISKQEYEFMLPSNPVTSKIHKGTTPLKGRPIVSGVGNLECWDIFR